MWVSGLFFPMYQIKASFIHFDSYLFIFDGFTCILSKICCVFPDAQIFNGRGGIAFDTGRLWLALLSYFDRKGNKSYKKLLFKFLSVLCWGMMKQAHIMMYYDRMQGNESNIEGFWKQQFKSVYCELLKFFLFLRGFTHVETEMWGRHLKGAASQRHYALKPPEDLLFSKNPVVSLSAPLQASSPHTEQVPPTSSLTLRPPPLQMVACPNLPQIKCAAGMLD